MFLYLLSLLCVVLYLLTREHLSRTRAHRECGNKMPGPKPLPIIGNALQFGMSTKSIFDTINGMVRIYGPVVRAWIGSQLVVLLSDPLDVELLLGGTKHINKSSYYKLGKSWVGQGLLTSPGEVWKLHRKIIAPTLSGTHIARFVDVCHPHLNVLVDKLSQYQNGPSFDIFPILSLFTLDVMCESIMGVKVNVQLTEDSEYIQAVNCMEDAVFNRAFRPWLHPYSLFRISSLGRLQAKYLPILKGTTRRIIQERKQQRSVESAVETKNNDIDDEEDDNGIKKRRPFLDQLLYEKEKGANLTDVDIEDHVNTFMIAGHDSTAASLSFTCWLLAKHQDIQERVVEELRSVFGSSLRQLVMQDLIELKYLEQVIKESLRLFPTVPLIARRLTEDLVTDKYVIPAGTEVAVHFYMLHRNSHHFPDPERFDPDRFLPENCARRHPYAYIPFSAGPRNCVGYKVSLYEIKTTLATLLRHFKVLPPENPFHDLEVYEHLILKPSNGIPVILQARNF